MHDEHATKRRSGPASHDEDEKMSLRRDLMSFQSFLGESKRKVQVSLIDR